MAHRRSVHLLLEHALVDGADCVLRPTEDLGAGSLRMPEGEFRDRAADAPLDLRRPKRRLVLAFTLAPFLRAVCVPYGHAHDGDRVIGASDGDDAGDSPA